MNNETSLVNSIVDILKDSDYSESYTIKCAKTIIDWSNKKSWHTPSINIRSYYEVIDQIGLGSENYIELISDIWKLIKDYHSNVSDDQFELSAIHNKV